jgi:hypothetical protein
MTRVWWRRLILTGLVAIAVAVVMLLLGMHPRVVLVCLIVAVVAAIGWLLLDVGGLPDEIDWERHAERGEHWPRADLRVSLIRARLHRERSRGDEWSSTSDDLAALIDARLRAAHGVDRSSDRGAATEILGPELTAFMDDPARRRRMCELGSLHHTLTLIEQL